MPADELPVVEFAFPGPLRDQLVAAILAGAKTTTTGLVADYEHENEPLPVPGLRQVVVDSAGSPVAVIETTAVRVMRLADVDLGDALGEGEGFTSVAEWRAGHEQFWHSAEMRQALGDPAFTVGDDTLVVASEFRLIHDLAQWSGSLSGFDDDEGRDGCLVGGPGGRITRPGIADRGYCQPGLLDRVHVVIFSPVGVLYGELAARGGHDTWSRVAAPQRPGVRVAEAPERVAERHRARGFQDECRTGRKVRAISAHACAMALSVRISMKTFMLTAPSTDMSGSGITLSIRTKVTLSSSRASAWSIMFWSWSTAYTCRAPSSVRNLALRPVPQPKSRKVLLPISLSSFATASKPIWYVVPSIPNEP